MHTLFTVILFQLFVFVLYAQPPEGYYSSTQNKNGEELMQELFGIIQNHTVLSYADLWGAFYETDIRPDGKVWDMYSSCSYTLGQDQDTGSGGNLECDVYNREHSFPRSWFGGAISPMNSDLFHIYPVDKKANAVRANYPFGEVGSNPTYTSSNGSKLGSSSYSGYSGTVFEPIDEYKGDFARTYFYMATRYYDLMHNWTSEMTNGTKFPGYEEWVVNMLLEWHEQDPVSEKEINRNNKIFEKYQHNRNPFIDQPEFALRIWGNETSANLIKPSDAVKIFPNPAKDLITITVPEKYSFEVAIYSIIGRELKKQSLEYASFSTEISIADLPSGIYLILINSNNIYVSKRLIISR